MKHEMRKWKDRMVAGSIVGLALGMAAGTAVGPVRAHEGEDAVDPRYGCRHDVEIPTGSIVSELRERSESLTFSPIVDQIAARFTQGNLDRYLRDLTGMNPVLVGGTPYTFATRYSYSTGGEKSWQYAYEQLQALGYQVRYQNYTRSGHALKNIIATIPGQTTPNKIYVLGGHLDSISQNPSSQAPGAEDNGSGSAAVLAAAVALAGERFSSTIELVLFTGEEQGLYGSQAYVNEALSQGRDVESAVTMDMISYTTTDYGVLIEGETAWSSLMQSMADATDHYTSLDRQFSYFSFGSDHVPFQDAGIPAILAIDLDWDEYPYYHRTTDTYEKTNPAFATEIGRAALATVAQLAGPLGPATDVASTIGRPWSLSFTPNPARSRVSIALANGQPGSEAGLLEQGVRIYDVRGREVRHLLPIADADGAHIDWNLDDAEAQPLRTGVYWARAGAASGRLLIVR